MPNGVQDLTRVNREHMKTNAPSFVSQSTDLALITSYAFDESTSADGVVAVGSPEYERIALVNDLFRYLLNSILGKKYAGCSLNISSKRDVFNLNAVSDDIWEFAA
jgi:hypothetical protein